MVGRFSYSFDRETFRGLYDTRQDALRSGMQEVPKLENPPETIFVGKRVPIDLGTSGLAEMILGAVRRRWRDASDDATSQQLLRVNEHQLAELDDAIDEVLKKWLAKHQLEPAQSKVIAISEHLVPHPAISNHASTGTEVTELGERESPITLW